MEQSAPGQRPRGQPLTTRLADETVSFIETHHKSHPDQPFLAYLAFYAVHSPIQTTRPLWQKYRDKAASQPAPAERFTIDRTLPVRQVQDHPVYAGCIFRTIKRMPVPCILRLFMREADANQAASRAEINPGRENRGDSP
jgi:hypothetical protein